MARPRLGGDKHPYKGDRAVQAENSPWKYLILWLRFYYAIHFLKSGINYAVFGVIPDFSKAGAVGPYLNAMNDIGFYPFIKYLEIVLGTMLLFNILTPLALAVMAGIAFQIGYLNLFVSPHPRQLFTGTQELLLCGLLILAYGKSYAGMLTARARPAFLWQK
ncbi:membrane protein [Bordetella pseudohinzii]|nr:membrane protein [Bordetella pseudohinzii]